jgi:N-acetylmuramoyl-L-alanine amidase
MRTINEIIVHCTATPAFIDYSAADIDRWHRDRGWKCCGYHFVVRLDGTVEIGRPLSMVGAHCKGHNANSIGICYVGGCDKNGLPADTRTDAQRIALRAVIRTLVASFPTIKAIVGHRDHAQRDCPCFDARAEYKAMLY